MYLSFFVYLASSVAGSYLEKIEQGKIEDPTKRYYDFVPLVWCYGITILCCYFLWFFSIKMEMTQFYQEKLAYLSDPWNWIDLLSFIFNGFFLVFINLNVAMGEIVIPIAFTRIFGAFCCFWMWIKVFYWMRLFSTTAYFINLII